LVGWVLLKIGSEALVGVADWLAGPGKKFVDGAAAGLCFTAS
jgi:hypothetical protein